MLVDRPVRDVLAAFSSSEPAPGGGSASALASAIGASLLYRLPKAPGEEQDARKAAIQRALRAATDVPLGVLRLSEAALDQAKTIAARGNRAAASDVGVAVALLRAGARGARLNIEINIGSISDAAYADAVRAETIGWSDAAARAADEADALVRGA